MVLAVWEDLQIYLLNVAPGFHAEHVVAPRGAPRVSTPLSQ
jgi:hypothetical protein